MLVRIVYVITALIRSPCPRYSRLESNSQLFWIFFHSFFFSSWLVLWFWFRMASCILLNCILVVVFFLQYFYEFWSQHARENCAVVFVPFIWNLGVWATAKWAKINREENNKVWSMNRIVKTSADSANIRIRWVLDGTTRCGELRRPPNATVRDTETKLKHLIWFDCNACVIHNNFCIDEPEMQCDYWMGFGTITMKTIRKVAYSLTTTTTTAIMAMPCWRNVHFILWNLCVPFEDDHGTWAPLPLVKWHEMHEA